MSTENTIPEEQEKIEKTYSEAEMLEVLQKLEELRQKNKQYYGTLSKIRRAMPGILGLSAATAIFVPRVMKWNAERDQYLNEDYTKAIEQLYTEHGQAIMENAQNFFLGTQEPTNVHYITDYLLNVNTENGITKLRETDPDLYQKIQSKIAYLYDIDTENEYAMTKGYSNFEELKDAALEKLPVLKEYMDGPFDDIPDDLKTQAISEALQFTMIDFDYANYATSEILKDYSPELLNYGIEQTPLSDQPILFSGTDEAFNIHYTAGETTPKDILNMKSDSPLDLSTMSSDTLLEFGLGAAAVGAGVAIVSAIVEKMTRNPEIEKEVFSDENKGLRKNLLDNANKLTSMLSNDKTNSPKEPKDKNNDGPSR